VLDKQFVRKQLKVAERDTHIVWGSMTLRDAIIMREAAAAILAQADPSFAPAQAIIRQFRAEADALFPVD
jgi:hypothetical protein